MSLNCSWLGDFEEAGAEEAAEVLLERLVLALKSSDLHRKTHEHTTLTQGLLGPRRAKKQARAVAAAALWVVCEHKTQAPPAPSNRKERPQRRAPYEFV